MPKKKEQIAKAVGQVYLKHKSISHHSVSVGKSISLDTSPGIANVRGKKTSSPASKQTKH